MQLDPESPDVRLAVFGRQVEDFLETDIGQYLQERASQEILEGERLLRTVDPFDSKAVMAAQNKVVVAETLMSWLAEAIQKGQLATQLLQEEQ